jgi:hypothetical protein
MFLVTPSVPNTSVERPLWLDVPGASRGVAAGWVVWLAAALLIAVAFAAPLGPAGAALGVLIAGWALALGMPAPTACLRRFHLDDAELLVIGPGARVQRLPWTLVDTIVQTRDGLRLAGAGVAVELPLAPLVRVEEWANVLARVVPELATEAWERIEDGESIRLDASLEPSSERLFWWAWVPAALACLATFGASGAVVVGCVALVERVLGFCAARARGVRLDRAGLHLRRGIRTRPLAWADLEVERTDRGLIVRETPGSGALLRVGLANFWVALPVIELRARLGFHCPPVVAFRVRRAEGGLAVVGEVETGA